MQFCERDDITKRDEALPVSSRAQSSRSYHREWASALQSSSSILHEHLEKYTLLGKLENAGIIKTNHHSNTNEERGDKPSKTKHDSREHNYNNVPRTQATFDLSQQSLTCSHLNLFAAEGSEAHSSSKSTTQVINFSRNQSLKGKDAILLYLNFQSRK